MWQIDRDNAEEPTKYVVNKKFASLQDLIAHYGTAGAGLRLDLGCGYYKPDGFIGIDNLSGEGAQIQSQANAPDILMDLNNHAIPLDENSCVEIRSSHFLEHSRLDHIINECFRLLRPGGIFCFAVPYANSAEGMYPGHSIFLTEKWFRENLNFQRKFDIFEESYLPSDDYIRLPTFVRLLIPFRYARTFLFNACKQMTLLCRVRK